MTNLLKENLLARTKENETLALVECWKQWSLEDHVRAGTFDTRMNWFKISNLCSRMIYPIYNNTNDACKYARSTYGAVSQFSDC